MPGLCASSSSACTSASLQPSYVLAALGAARERIDGSVRFSLGRWTSADEIDRALELLMTAVETERSEGPLDLCAPG